MLNTKNIRSSPLRIIPFHGPPQCHGEDSIHVCSWECSCGIRNEREVFAATDTQNPSHSSPKTLNLLDRLTGDESYFVSSTTRNETVAANNNVSLELTLSTGPKTIWDITKTLTMSDVNGAARLIIPKESVDKYIFKYFTKEEIRMVEDEDEPGLVINVSDEDTKSTHKLCFKRWKSTGSYVLNNNWSKDFVIRRELKVGEIIGLYWNPHDSKLHLSVISRPKD